MTTLTAFLLERIAEDEEVARATLADFGLARDLEGPMLAHVAHFDPARILTESEAKRRIAEDHAEVVGLVLGRSGMCSDDNRPYPCLTLRIIAHPYASHPDFDPSWAIS